MDKILPHHILGKKAKIVTPKLAKFCQIFKIIVLLKSPDVYYKVYNVCNPEVYEIHANFESFVDVQLSPLHKTLHKFKAGTGNPRN